MGGVCFTYRNTGQAHITNGGCVDSGDQKCFEKFPGPECRQDRVNFDLPGSDLPGNPHDSADINVCRSLCDTTAGCKAFVYGTELTKTAADHNKCWLKDGDSTTGATAMTGVISGFPCDCLADRGGLD